MTGVSDFYKLESFDNFYHAQSKKLACIAFGLKTGGMCVYSPIKGSAAKPFFGSDRVEAVTAILAPNHYHNAGVSEFADAFPRASVICSKVAKPRLQKVTGLKFQTIEVIEPELPKGMNLLEPPGLKTGEVWISIEFGHSTALIVTDAFSSGFSGPGVYESEPEMLSTFPKYGVKDAAIYKNWACQTISSFKPTLLLPCHGSPVKHPDLSARLLVLLDATF